MFQQLSLKIRRRETPFYDRLYRLAKKIRQFEIPVIRPLYQLLRWERSLRVTVWDNFTRIVYHTPIFKLGCHHVGKALYLIGGTPQVLGHLRMVIGDNVQMHGKSTFVGAKVFETPTLTVGNNTHLGYQLVINVGCDVTIGNNVLIAGGVSICSYDGHPSDPAKRHLPAPPESSRPVVIKDNVWIGVSCIILKGVTIGENSVVSNGSVVMSRVPPNTLAFGNPARCVPLPF